MRSLENTYFYCDDFKRKTTINKCKRCCSKSNSEECARERLAKDMEMEEQIAKVKALQNKKCDKCGSYLVDHLYFAFCPNCGLDFDEDDEEVEE